MPVKNVRDPLDNRPTSRPTRRELPEKPSEVFISHKEPLRASYKIILVILLKLANVNPALASWCEHCVAELPMIYFLNNHETCLCPKSDAIVIGLVPNAHANLPLYFSFADVFQLAQCAPCDFWAYSDSPSSTFKVFPYNPRPTSGFCFRPRSSSSLDLDH